VTEIGGEAFAGRDEKRLLFPLLHFLSVRPSPRKPDTMSLVERLLDKKTYYRGPADLPRLALALIFSLSAFIKNLDPLFFLQVVNQFQNLPIKLDGLMPILVIYGIVGTEYSVAICALFGLFSRITVVVAFLLNGLFVFVLAMHWGESLGLGCGCLGFPKETVVGLAVFWKNLLLLIVTVLAAIPAFKGRKPEEVDTQEG